MYKKYVHIFPTTTCPTLNHLSQATNDLPRLFAIASNSFTIPCTSILMLLQVTFMTLLLLKRRAPAAVRSLHRLLSHSPLRPLQRHLLRVPLQLQVSFLFGTMRNTLLMGHQNAFTFSQYRQRIAYRQQQFQN